MMMGRLRSAAKKTGQLNRRAGRAGPTSLQQIVFHPYLSIEPQPFPASTTHRTVILSYQEQQSQGYQRSELEGNP